MITYKPFWETIAKKNISKYYLKTYCDVHNRIIQKLQRDEPLNTVTIDRLCEILDCNVQDVMAYEKTKKP